MGILDFEAAAKNNNSSRTSAARTAPADRPQAKVWMNVGYDVEFTNEQGELETRFINLPVGIPLDTMEPLAIRGQNESFAHLRAAQNNLLSELQAAGDALEPGEEKTVNLTIRLRKVNDAINVSDTSNNPFVKPLAGLVG